MGRTPATPCHTRNSGLSHGTACQPAALPTILLGGTPTAQCGAPHYDYALSFAGSDRDIAEALFRELQEREFEIFYDKNEQHRILAEDVEEYLGRMTDFGRHSR